MDLRYGFIRLREDMDTNIKSISLRNRLISSIYFTPGTEEKLKRLKPRGAFIHNTTVGIRLSFWRMKMTGDATNPVHLFVAKSEM